MWGMIDVTKEQAGFTREAALEYLAKMRDTVETSFDWDEYKNAREAVEALETVIEEINFKYFKDEEE